MKKVTPKVTEASKNLKPTYIYLYKATIPVYINSLTNLLLIIAKAEQFAKKNKVPTSEIIASQLAPDMLTFAQQIQYAYFSALDCASHLSTKKPPTFSYDEKTLEDLKKSIQKTIEYLKTIKSIHFKDAENKKVPVYYKKEKLLPAISYINTLSLPNFFFHYTTAYDILRHIRVQIGKADYIGAL